MASVAAFEHLASVLLTLARSEYMKSPELTPKLVVMGVNPADSSAGYSVGLVPVSQFMTQEAGAQGAVVIAAVIDKLVSDPEVLVVGYMAEAWRAEYPPDARDPRGARLNPEEAPNREEVLLLNLRSTYGEAIKTCRLHRAGPLTAIEDEGGLQFHAVPPGSTYSSHLH